MDTKVSKILIVDDHKLVRAGILALIASLDEAVVVGEAGDGVEALVMIDRLHPDILLLDVAMPRLNGLQTAARVVKDYPATKVIILTMHTDEEYVREAIRSGVSGYVLKDADAAEFAMALKAVARGETYLSPAVSRQLMTDYARIASGTNAKESLTSRQREILRMIAEGKTTKAIALKLEISAKTVECIAHRSWNASISTRLQVSSDTPSGSVW